MLIKVLIMLNAMIMQTFVITINNGDEPLETRKKRQLMLIFALII